MAKRLTFSGSCSAHFELEYFSSGNHLTALVEFKDTAWVE